LRSKSTGDVLAHAGGANTSGSAYHHSTVDGQVLPETQLAALLAGRINRVPVVQGATRHEGRFFLPPALTADEYRVVLALIAAGTGKGLDQILATYPLGAYASPFEAASAAYGDVLYACSANAANQLLSRWVRTYAYEFDDANAGPLGATHAAELPYLFDLTFGGTPGGGPGSLPAPSQALARTIRAYWTTFAQSGDPNASGLPEWKPLADSRVQVLRPPAPRGESATDYGSRHHCTFWNSPNSGG
jgi:para-nitrobenzyl esterase